MLVLIDGNSSIYRAYYAIRHLSASDGTPTNAVFGFVQILHKILEDFRPTHLGVAFDVARKTFRHDLFPDYKSQRKPMPEDMVPQIPTIKRILKLMRFPVLELEDYEADDVIGTIAGRFSSENLNVLIVSSDKDLIQLLTDRVSMYHTTWNTLVTPADVKEKYGFGPEHFTDYLAIMGDSSDNIPGVRGIGEKGAGSLVSTYGSIEEIYRRIDEIGGAAKNKLREGKEQAFLSKELAAIRCDLPIPVEMADLKREEADTKSLKELYVDLGFTSLIKKLETPSAPVSVDVMESPPDWSSLTSVAVVPSGNGFSVSDGRAVYRVEEKELKDHAGGDLHLVCHHAGDLLRRSILPASKDESFWDDVELMAYVLDPGRGGTSLKDLAAGILGLSRVEEESAVLLKLFQELKTRLAEDNLFTAYETLEKPLVPVIRHMETAGIRINPDVLEALSAELADLMNGLEERIYFQAGHPFNINSPKQLREVLYEEMKIKPPGIKTSKTREYSTGEAALKELIERGLDLPVHILSYREYAKLKGTYLDPIPKLLDTNRRLHTTYNQAVTSTGRLSSSDPNVQNIPIRTAIGRKIREAFCAPPGCLLIGADYSQIELRLLAHFAEDPVLIEAFQRDADIHTATASKIFDLPEERVNSDMRRRAKTINFGVLYGMSAHGLSRELGISRDEAARFIESYFERFPRVRDYFDGLLSEARDTGEVRTIGGRVRRLPELKSGNYQVRSNAERMAINAPLQGSAADIIKLAMIRVWKDFIQDQKDVKIVLQVHDELLFEALESEAGEVAKTVKTVMETIMPLSVPLKVDVGIAGHWGDLK